MSELNEIFLSHDIEKEYDDPDEICLNLGWKIFEKINL